MFSGDFIPYEHIGIQGNLELSETVFARLGLDNSIDIQTRHISGSLDGQIVKERADTPDGVIFESKDVSADKDHAVA